MLERLKWPGLALLLAVLGNLVRRWQLATAFEDELGLAVPGAPASWALLGFFALSILLFALLARRAKVEQQDAGPLSRWDFAFAAEGDAVYLALMVLAGLLTLAAVPLLFQEAADLVAAGRAAMEGEAPVLQVILMVCAIPGALGLALSGGMAFGRKGKGKENALLLLPVLFCCVWLLEGYRANAADPVLWDYVPLLVAVAFSLLFQMESAGLAFSEGHPRRMLFLAGMTAASCGAAAGDFSELSSALPLAGEFLAALAALWIAPGNLARVPDPVQFGAAEDREKIQQD